MLRWGIILIILAIVASVLGFGTVAGVSMQAAYWLIAAAVILIIVFAIFGHGGGPTITGDPTI